MELIKPSSTLKNVIIVLSIAIPVVVAVLLFSPSKITNAGSWIYFLPHFNAIINSLTSVMLIAGAYVIIKNKDIELHRTFMSTSFILGALFLVSYVIYHAGAESTKFGDLDGDGIVSSDELAQVGIWRSIYLGILLFHILLAVVVVPFVLFAFYYALSNQIEKHRKVVKFTYPIWLVVSVTGVIVYFMISPYY
ncbi:MAG: DUF420 domain-containing protein [Cyclobacteriaceae bacterium]|nr:DUF420 domain-containing protein [Cyclobacteriaceae bacterium]MCH8515165.1 DUF420 domain-containing protein [Cyclobacteriaceae bacterium]